MTQSGVFYSPTRYDVSSAFRRLANAKAGTSVPNHAILAALHKAEEWRYEQEWRIINPDGREVDGFTIPMTKPRAVHAGLHMTKTDKERLTAICTAKSVPIFDVSLSPERYEIVLTKA